MENKRLGSAAASFTRLVVLEWNNTGPGVASGLPTAGLLARITLSVTAEWLCGLVLALPRNLRVCVCACVSAWVHLCQVIGRTASERKSSF